MAMHFVFAQMPELRIEKKGIKFKIWEDDTRIATVSISNGGMGWRGRHGKRTMKWTWAQFEKVGNGKRKRKKRNGR